MKLWIIYSKVVLNPLRNNAVSWMLDEAVALGFDAQIIYCEDLMMGTSKDLTIYHKGEITNLPDVAFLRTYDISMIEHLERMGIQTFNTSKALNACLDKWHTHQILTNQNIPSPKTLFSLHAVSYVDIKKQLSLPFIIKDNKGARGEQVYLIHNEDEFDQATNQCQDALFQEYINTSYGKDIRVHVIGDRVVATVLRVSESDFKSNYSQGGQALPYELDDIGKQLAIKSTHALGLHFSGVDLLFTEHGYTVCEVNGVPGFRTVGLTSETNLPHEMLRYIKENI